MSLDLEHKINNLLASFAVKHSSDLVNIEECVFRGLPRSMEYSGRSLSADDQPLIDLAQKIDALILAEPREECLRSSSPYIRDCAKWYRDHWDVMFLLEDASRRVVDDLLEDPNGPHWESEAMMQDVFDTLASRGIISEISVDEALVYSTPVDSMVLLPDRIISRRPLMKEYGEDFPVGEVWITTDGEDRTRRFVKVSQRGVWYRV